MGSEDTDLMEEGGGGSDAPVASQAAATCSICFEAVVDNGGRSWAKLQCEHKFHLDCIGSAFNVKGLMQCPNCRKIEKGQWLFANGCRSSSEFSIDDWANSEDIYDLSYSEVPFGFHWCPFGGLTRVSSSFEERELASNAYHDLFGHHAIFTEHANAASVASSCPYFAYFQPLQPSSSNSYEGIGEDPGFGHHWSGLSGHSDISTSNTVPTVDLHYQTWDHQIPFPVGTHSSVADQASVSRTLRSRGDSDGQTRSGSAVHPVFLRHGSGPRVGSSVVSAAVPLYPGSNSRSYDRALGHSYQQQQPSAHNMRLHMFSTPRRANGSRSPLGPVASSSEYNNALYMYPSSGSFVRNLQQADNSLHGYFYAWERDRFVQFPLLPAERESGWWVPPLHQAANGSDSSSRSNTVWQSHNSERSRTENPSHSQNYPTGPPLHPFI